MLKIDLECVNEDPDLSFDNPISDIVTGEIIEEGIFNKNCM